MSKTILTTDQACCLMWIADALDGVIYGAKDRVLNALRERGLLARRVLPVKGRHGKAIWTVTQVGRSTIKGRTECIQLGCCSRHTFNY